MNVMFLHEMGINPVAGGISRMTSVLTSGLRSKGFNVFYLSMIKLDSVDYDDNQFFFPDSDVPTGDENTNYLIQFVRENSIDILINQATSSLIYRELSFVVKHIGVKVISVIHNSLLTPITNFAALNENRIIDLGLSFLLPLIKNRLFVSLLKKLYKLKHQNHYNLLLKISDRVVLVSENNITDFLFIISSRNLGNLIAINNAISLKEYEYKRSDKIKEVLWVGTPDFSIKRLDLALRIWGLVEKTNPDWVFTVLGDSSSLNRAKKLAKELNLSRVNFLGRHDPVEYYKRASFLIMTSTTESFGLVLIEAMHFGIIPFSFDSFPASGDIIESKKNGILISSFDIESYAKELSLLMNDPGRTELMAINSKKKSEKYNINVIISQWISLFKQL